MSTICCCTDVVTVNHPPSNTSGGQVSNHSTGAVDYKTWQHDNIDSKLYLGHGIFLYKANNTNSSDRDWLIKTDDIPKLFHLSFPASDTDDTGDSTDESPDKPVVRSWVLGLACFVGGLLIMVAITVAILARKWMHRSMNRRNRFNRQIENDQNQIVVEADPDAPKLTGPPTVCGRVPRPSPRFRLPHDDGLPPYVRLESPTGYSITPDPPNQGRSHHPLDLPLPRYSELPTVPAVTTTRHLQQEEDTNDTSNSIHNHSDTYSHPSDQNHNLVRTSYPVGFSRQSSGNSNSGNENMFIPDWCEGEDLSAPERNILGQSPCYHRQEPREKQEINPIDITLSATDSSSQSTPSHHRPHHFSNTSSGSVSHIPELIPTVDGFPEDVVSNRTHRAKRTQSPSVPIENKEMWSYSYTETNSDDIPSKTRSYQSNTSFEELRGNDVRGESLTGASSTDHLSLRQDCMTQANVMDSGILMDMKEGVFIPE